MVRNRVVNNSEKFGEFVADSLRKKPYSKTYRARASCWSVSEKKGYTNWLE